MAHDTTDAGYAPVARLTFAATSATAGGLRTMAPSHRTIEQRRAAFQAVLQRAARSHQQGTGPAPASSMGELVEQISTIELHDEPAPTWMIEALHAAGMSRLAHTLMLRNRRLVPAGSSTATPARMLTSWPRRSEARTLRGQVASRS